MSPLTIEPIAPTYIYRATALKVHDGDTYTMQVDLGFRCAITIQVRLHGWSCPELSDPLGPEATVAAAKLLGGGPVVIQSYKDQRSFERWVADVYVTEGKEMRHLGECLGRLNLAQTGARVGIAGELPHR